MKSKVTNKKRYYFVAPMHTPTPDGLKWSVNLRVIISRKPNKGLVVGHPFALTWTRQAAREIARLYNQRVKA